MSDNTAHTDSASSRPLAEDRSGSDSNLAPEAVHTRFDDGSDSVVFAIVEAVAAVTNRELASLSPLYETVDPEALADLVTSTRDRPVNVSFSYESCRVTVSSNGCLVVEPPEN